MTCSLTLRRVGQSLPSCQRRTLLLWWQVLCQSRPSSLSRLVSSQTTTSSIQPAAERVKNSSRLRLHCDTSYWQLRDFSHDSNYTTPLCTLVLRRDLPRRTVHIWTGYHDCELYLEHCCRAEPGKRCTRSPWRGEDSVEPQQAAQPHISPSHETSWKSCKPLRNLET